MSYHPVFHWISYVRKSTCDLGASVSVMPKNVFEKLCLPEPEPTAMFLELADNSVRYPLGIAEDVLIKIGDHSVPVDFVILDMGEGSNTWEAFP